MYQYRRQMLNFLNKQSRGIWKPYNEANADEKMRLVRSLNEWDFQRLSNTLNRIATRVLQ